MLQFAVLHRAVLYCVLCLLCCTVLFDTVSCCAVPCCAVTLITPHPHGRTHTRTHAHTRTAIRCNTIQALEPETRFKLFDQLSEILGALHALDFKALGLEKHGKQGNYAARQIKTWGRQFRLGTVGVILTHILIEPSRGVWFK